MTIKDVYNTYGIPPNLQEHMIRVASVVAHIEEHWIGPTVEWKIAIQTALLHDIGNIVKFDLDNHPEFLGEGQNDLECWRNKQQEMIKTYGSDDHEATRKILFELDVDKNIIETILLKSFSNSINTKNSNNWILKILYYADLRVLPFGIGTLDNRINDVKDRMPKYTNRPDFMILVNACYDIESQIQDNLDIQINEMSNETIPLNQAFLATTI